MPCGPDLIIGLGGGSCLDLANKLVALGLGHGGRMRDYLTEYGLIAYVFTRDLPRGLRMSENIDAGMVALNRGLVPDPAAPFGGTTQSGLGHEGGHHGIMEFVETKLHRGQLVRAACAFLPLCARASHGGTRAR